MAYLTNIGGTQLTSLGEGNLTTLAGPDQFNITNNIEIPFRYAYEFTNEGGIKYWVGITNKRYVGATSTLSPTSLGFSLQYNGPTNEHYQPIISTEATFELIYDATAAEMVADMIDSVPTEYIAFIYKWNTSTELYDIWWRGIVNTETLQTPDASTTNPHGTVTITADDGFGYLENILFVPDLVNEPYKFMLDLVSDSVFQIFGNTTIANGETYLSSCCVWFDDDMTQDQSAVDPLAETFVDANAFMVLNDFGVVEGMNYREILENILQAFHLWIFQSEGKYVLIEPNAYAFPNIGRWDYQWPGLSNGAYSEIWATPSVLPDRFGPSGVFSNIVKYGRVNARYAYKSSPYGDSLMPPTITPQVVTNNVFDPVTYNFYNITTDDSLHIEGSAKTIIDHPTGSHTNDFYFGIVYRITAFDGVDSYQLDIDDNWSTGTETLINTTEKFRLLYNYPQTQTNYFNLNIPNPPIDCTIAFSIEEAFILEPGETTAWTDPTGGHDLDYTTTFQNDWLATINNSGDMSGEEGYYASVTDSGLLEYDLADTILGDGLTVRHISALQTGSVATSVWIGPNTAAAAMNLHRLRCNNMIGWIRNTVRTYEGSFYGEFNFLNYYTSFDSKEWIWSAGTYYANDNKFDGTLIQLVLNYGSITTGSDGTANGNGTGTVGGALGVADQYWQRNNTTLSPVTDGDDVQTSGQIGSVTSASVSAVLEDSWLWCINGNSQGKYYAGYMDFQLVDSPVYYQTLRYNAITTGLELWKLEIRGLAVSDPKASVKLSAKAGANTWSGSDNAGSFEIQTVQDADTALVTRFKINSDATVDIGGSTNYAKFEKDGTLVFNGDATVYDDINVPVIPRNTGTGTPSRATITGGLRGWSFAVNDYAELGEAEFLHGWKEGTAMEIHCHWLTGGTNDTTTRGVKWQIEYGWANAEGKGAPEAISSSTTVSTETSIPSGQVAGTHKYTSITSFTPTGGKIGAQMSMTITRIASVTNTAPVANPILMSIGIHYQIDTLGSRTTSSK